MWAHTIEEAEAIYHKSKERMQSSESSIAPQSTAPAEEDATE